MCAALVAALTDGRGGAAARVAQRRSAAGRLIRPQRAAAGPVAAERTK